MIKVKARVPHFVLFCSELCCVSLLFCVWQLDGIVVVRWEWREKWTRNQGGVEEQMGKNGGARNWPILIQSTVKDTCIEGRTVQESMWKKKKQLVPV